ncbi:hypothetical protein ACFFMP_01405 [Pseudoroseomonas cervicalis]|uniref:hypothetical protein n=1 Tax=Teichococcus cervicalis TaxID=204525 RepID=UPI0035E90759
MPGRAHRPLAAPAPPALSRRLARLRWGCRRGCAWDCRAAAPGAAGAAAPGAAGAAAPWLPAGCGAVAALLLCALWLPLALPLLQPAPRRRPSCWPRMVLALAFEAE